MRPASLRVVAARPAPQGRAAALLRRGLAAIGLAAMCAQAVGCTSPPPPSPPSGLTGDFEEDFLKARNDLLDYVDGAEGGTVPKAEIEALYAQRPQDPKVLAYLGSLRLLEGRAEVIPWKKGALCEEGLRLLDRAVADAPEDLEIRFVRGRSTLPLPFFFNRETRAREDILFVAARAVDAALADRLDPVVAAAALLAEGKLRDEGGDSERARRSWEAAAELAPDSRYGRAARELLESR